MKTVNGNHLAELPKIVTLPKLSAPESEIQTQVKVAAEHLFKGEVIATPTDTIYGLAALANNTKAVTKIYDIKGEWFFILLLQLNEYETDPYFLQNFQTNTKFCLIIHMFCKSCEAKIVLAVLQIKTKTISCS
jgi:hypothetical protein